MLVHAKPTVSMSASLKNKMTEVKQKHVTGTCHKELTWTRLLARRPQWSHVNSLGTCYAFLLSCFYQISTVHLRCIAIGIISLCCVR